MPDLFTPWQTKHFSGCITLLTHVDISKNEREPGSSPPSSWHPTSLLFPSKWLYTVSISSLHSLFKPLEPAFLPRRFKKFLQDLLAEESQLYWLVAFYTLGQWQTSRPRTNSEAGQPEFKSRQDRWALPPWPLSCLISQSLSFPAVTWRLWLYWSTRQATVSTEHSILHSGSIQRSVTYLSFHSTSLPDLVPHSYCSVFLCAWFSDSQEYASVFKSPFEYLIPQLFHLSFSPQAAAILNNCF